MTVKTTYCPPMRSGKGKGPYYVFAKSPPKRSVWGPFWDEVGRGVSAFFSALWKAIVWVAKVLLKICYFLSAVLFAIGLLLVMNDIYEGITSRKK